MARLPASEQEWANLMEDRLQEVWDNIGSAEDQDLFFGKAGAILGGDLSIQGCIRIAQAMAGYCYEIRSGLDAKDLSEARRLVRGVRREIADMQKRLAEAERRLVGAKEGAARRKVRSRAGSDCWAIFENARQHYAQMKMRYGFDGLPLAEADRIVWEAIDKVAPPFDRADCAGALAILDALLGRWAKSTGSRKGQAFRSKALAELIEGLEQVFRDATGGEPAGRTKFQKFVKHVLSALPPGAYNATMVGVDAVPTRIRRQVSGTRPRRIPAGPMKRPPKNGKL